MARSVKGFTRREFALNVGVSAVEMGSAVVGMKSGASEITNNAIFAAGFNTLVFTVTIKTGITPQADPIIMGAGTAIGVVVGRRILDK